MESFGNEIKVQQGEDWSLNKILSASNKEYIPYLISSERPNPFFVITVASTKYEKNYRYVKSWWNSISNLHIPTFYQTVPQYLGEVDSLENIVLSASGNTATLTVTNTVDDLISDEPTITQYNETYETRLLYQYVLSTEDIDITLGHRPYHYIYVVYNNELPTELSIPDSYRCQIRFEFSSRDTSNWGSQDYMYQITLVDGQLMEDRLQEIYNYYKPSDWPTTQSAQYKYVKIQWPNELQPDIDIDSPLGYIQSPEPILSPTKLYVYNNLRNII